MSDDNSTPPNPYANASPEIQLQLAQRELYENPIGMSAEAKAILVAKHGPEIARRMRVEASRSQAAGIKIEGRRWTPGR